MDKEYFKFPIKKFKRAYLDSLCILFYSFVCVCVCVVVVLVCVWGGEGWLLFQVFSNWVEINTKPFYGHFEKPSAACGKWNEYDISSRF